MIKDFPIFNRNNCQYFISRDAIPWYLYLFEYGALETPSGLDYFLKIRAMNCSNCNCQSTAHNSCGCQAMEAMVLSSVPCKQWPYKWRCCFVAGVVAEDWEKWCAEWS